MIALLKRLWRDRRGNVLILAGAGLPMLVGAAGIATDTIQWAMWKRQLQRAADSAAIAGVYTRIKTDTEDAVDAAITEDLTINHHTGITLKAGSPDIDLLGDDGDMRKPVRVTLEVERALPFSSMFMSAAPVIRATATAASVPGAAEYCIFATDPSASAIGIEISGSADLDLGECSLMANSKNPNKAASNGSNSSTGGQASTVKARSLAAAGGVQESSAWTVDSYDPYSTPLEDPFASTPVPTSSDCDKNITMDGAAAPDRSSTDVAGEIVCITNVKNGKPTGLTVGSNVKLGPATYVINGGDLTMSSTTSGLSCAGCTIVMTDFADRSKTGSIKLTGGTLSLTAPTSGDYKGIALFQDPLATDSGKKTQNQVNGSSGAAVVGVIYIPNQSFLYNGGGNLTSVCMQLVAKRIELSGSSNIKISSECAAAGLSPIGSGADNARRVRLIA